MGRRKDKETWREYTRGPGKSVVCNHCRKSYKFANVSKMRTHLENCAKCPLDIRQALSLKNGDQQDENRDPLSCISSQNMPSSNSESLKEIHSKQNEDEYDSPVLLFTITEAARTKLNEKLSKAIYVTGAPLSMTEHPLWKDFFNDLQPMYKMPTRKNLSTTLLEKTYTDMKEEMNEILAAANDLHLQCDGWSNIRNEGIINFIISRPEPAFVKFLNTEDNRHTSDYISQEVIKIMEEYGQHKFFVLIGDNAKNMQLAFKKVLDIYPHVIPLGCVAHGLHLLCQDFIKCNSVNSFSASVTNIIKSIKNSQLLCTLYNKIVQEKHCGEQLKLPCKTRWGSNATSLESFKKSKSCLQALAVHEKSVLTRDTKSALLEEEFWVKIDNAIEILKPCSDWIKKIEGNDCNIHKVYKVFTNIETAILTSTIIDNDEKKELLNKSETTPASPRPGPSSERPGPGPSSESQLEYFMVTDSESD
ncbi:uncharacterized protein LOC126372036 [Pectinophora gossypiella]|uniref:uncharacterized protein LOC126372036 n=1 Tax=Pectinophora gossypiella TaxID=13191 RepID=UPI00214EE204|nr:uncharacterized protein LOC126372036 [Pectinophora gossypiella]